MPAPDTLLQNRYRIIRQLGAGGQGEVYEAFDQRLNIHVALKQIFATDDRSRKAFEREAQLLARLKHDSLPQVIDHFFEGNGQFLVMEFVPGDNLAELAEHQKVPFTTDEVLDWGDQLLGALEYLHQRHPPILHRDIKPQNLKLDESGRIVLLDFGMAKEAVATTIVRGYSHHYSPLEQIRGRRADERSDLYAAAATIYYLITGKIPPDAETRDEALGNGFADPLTSAHQVNPHVTPVVATTLSQSLALIRERRPATAAAMREMLRRARQQHLQSGPSAETILGEPSSIWQNKTIDSKTITARPTAEGSPLDLTLGRQRSRFIDSQAADHHGEPLAVTPPDRKTRDSTQQPRKLWAAIAVAAIIISASLGYWVWTRERIIKGMPNGSRAENTISNQSPAAKPQPRIVALHYYLELLEKGRKARRIADEVPLIGGQEFKFHFVPSHRGYLYLIAPGDKKTPQTFLTANPDPKTGVSNNMVEANGDWEFPRGEGNTLRIDKETPFTVIFSSEQLSEPDFLVARALHNLSADQQREFEKWRERFSSQRPEISVDQSGSLPKVAVKVLTEKLGYEPIIFEIRIKRL